MQAGINQTTQPAQPTGYQLARERLNSVVAQIDCAANSLRNKIDRSLVPSQPSPEPQARKLAEVKSVSNIVEDANVTVAQLEGILACITDMLNRTEL